MTDVESRSELTAMTAQALAGLLRGREVSATEVVTAHLRRIEDRNSGVNAICTSSADSALEEAARADEAHLTEEDLPALHGVPIVHKDLLDTAGLRTTYGSEAFATNIPGEDALIVSRCRQAGAIILGKSNTPQFGTGGHTENRLFGVTRNPWDLRLSVGGSSGGSAAALAAGMTPLATGTDMAGSLRIPASFCNVVGMRPSAGRIPYLPTSAAWFPYVVAGPMARTVADVALLLSVVAGPDSRAPISLESHLTNLPIELNLHLPSQRVAWAPSISELPVAQEVRSVLDRVLPTVIDSGARVDRREPDLDGADEVFLTWRSWYYASQFGHLYRDRSEVLDDATVANIEAGLELTGAELGRAEELRSLLHRRVADFFDEWDFLLMPSTPVGAFPADQWRPDQLDGEEYSTHLSWMRHLYYVSATCLPALSLPAGFTDDGKPVGIQIVAGPRQDVKLLQFASELEARLGHSAGRVAPVRVS